MGIQETWGLVLGRGVCKRPGVFSYYGRGGYARDQGSRTMGGGWVRKRPGVFSYYGWSGYARDQGSHTTGGVDLRETRALLLRVGLILICKGPGVSYYGWNGYPSDQVPRATIQVCIFGWVYVGWVVCKGPGVLSQSQVMGGIGIEESKRCIFFIVIILQLWELCSILKRLATLEQ